LGIALSDKQDLDGAIAEYRQAIALNPKYVTAHNNLGLALKAKGDLDGAIAEYRQAIALDRKFASAHNNLGIALSDKQDLDGAIAEFRQAIALDPKNAPAHNNLGVALQAKGHLDGALAEYRQAIALNPKYAEAHDSLGFALQAKGDLDGALAEYRRAIALNPKYALAHNNLAWALATWPDSRRRDPAQAVAAAKRAVELAPKNGGIWNTLGVAHYRNGDAKAAVEALERSMALSRGGDAADWFFLAMARWQLGQKDQARKWYQQAAAWTQKNQPNNAELRRFRAEAAALLGLSAPDAAPKEGSK
jgi:tetratricopeptide (TPR) repeat protein